ncbi:MAG: alpha/beta hydrolase [Deltaproteobacteria bacterium]|nr:alpha/beta hydrolase [Deltaproteobacteria bacterium]
MRAEEFIFSDGRRLVWRSVGDGPTLVLIHGWSVSGLVFTEVASSLKKKCRVLMPDLPGHGGSSPKKHAELSNLADDLEEWLRGIGGGQVVLGGWSLGGMLSMELACRLGSNLSGMILIGTTPRFTKSSNWRHGLPRGQVRALLRNLERRYEGTLRDFFNLTFVNAMPSKHRLKVIRKFAVENSHLPDETTTKSLLENLEIQDQRNLLPDLKVPCLLIHGAKDEITPVDAAKTLAAHITDSRLIIFEDASHAPFWSCPDLFVKQIKEYLEWLQKMP